MPLRGATLNEYSPLTKGAARSDSGREATVVAQRQGVVGSAFLNPQDNPLKASRLPEIFSRFHLRLLFPLC